MLHFNVLCHSQYQLKTKLKHIFSLIITSLINLHYKYCNFPDFVLITYPFWENGQCPPSINKDSSDVKINAYLTKRYSNGEKWTEWMFYCLFLLVPCTVTSTIKVSPSTLPNIDKNTNLWRCCWHPEINLST